MLPRLSAGTTPAGALPHGRAQLPTSIVHIGLGNFHRAHQAVHTAAALAADDGPWGILGVASRSTNVADAMRAQDMRYAVVELAPAETRVSVPAVHTGALVAAREPDEVLGALAAPGTRVVSLTVTEHGYTFDPGSGGLDRAHPEVVADLRGWAQQTAPRSTLGLLVRGLQQRARTHGAPVTIMSCDNIVHNGRMTGRLVAEFVAELPAAERGELETYLGAVSFPDAMVDRIVPATTDAHREIAAAHLGARDAIPVPAEPFSMWVVQDAFAAGRPAWERGGALVVDDVEPYELLKLRLLNGTHSLIAYLGALDGRDTIPESVASEQIRGAADRVLRQDYLPTVPVPVGLDLEEYVARLFDRWSNTALGHRTRQVGSDGSVKLAQRVPEPALSQLKAGRMPHHLALTVAACLCCVAPPEGFDPGPHAAAMTDPARAWLGPLARLPTRSFVTEALGTGVLGDELAAHTAFTERVSEFIDVLTRHGVAAATREALDLGDPVSAS